MNEDKNIAETLARVLPKAEVIVPVLTHPVMLVTLPDGVKVEQVDLSKYLPAPRRKTGTAAFSDVDSFAAYVARHVNDKAVAWCAFNPQTFALSFTAVLDDHGSLEAGWRGHRATFTPDMSAEWKAWKARDAKPFGQVEFAEFIEANADDITTPPLAVGEQPTYPTDLQMLAMATNFVAQEERTLKSAVKLQSGGVRLNYIADPDAGTVESMEMFAKFMLGIPVFQGAGRIGMFARLKYRLSAGKVSFFYELIRADRVHEAAAKSLIDAVRESLGSVPLLMGNLP